MSLVDELIKDGWLKTKEIIESFREIKRKDFLTEETKNLSELNEALPIGFEQTISQPLTVAFMLELLQPKSGDRVLDVGFGSGWTTALLAQIVQPLGRVFAIERIPEIKDFGERNIKKYNFIKKGLVKTILGDGSEGFKDGAPYDKILVSASASSLSESFKHQLKPGGRIVIPIENSIYLYIKKNGNEFQEKKYPGFVFVPLVSKDKK